MTKTRHRREWCFCTSLVQFCYSRLKCRTALSKPISSIAVFSVEQVPFLHVPEIADQETLYMRKLALQIKTNLLNNATTPNLFNLLDGKITSKRLIGKKLFKISLHASLDLRLYKAAFRIKDPARLFGIKAHIAGMYNLGRFCGL